MSNRISLINCHNSEQKTSSQIIPKIMSSSKQHRSNTDSFDSVNAKHVDNLLAMIAKANTTSVLHQLEYHRQNRSTSAFPSLLLSLTTKLNSTNSMKFEDHRNVHAFETKRRKLNSYQQIPTKTEIDHCCYIILCYIVAVIHKHQIPSVENLWNEILENVLTKNPQFYQYLHKKKIMIPNEILKLFSKKFCLFYAGQSPRDRIKLIELGFIFDGMITAQTSIKDIEKIFSQLKQRDYQITEPDKLIAFMNTPEKLSLFLSHFHDYDINQVNKQTPFNVLEQLIKMKPYFYLSSNYLQSQLQSRPNEMFKYRAVRIVNLLQQLISRGARLSVPIYSSILFQGDQDGFFTTSIGTYVFLGLNMNDLYPSLSSAKRDDSFVSIVIRNIERFCPEFREFILHYLSRSYSIIHTPKFIFERRQMENEREQKINDKLFQQPIKLKDWCRLKIKDNCSQKHIQQLNLSKSLTNYCSFGFSNSNYALQCITEVERHKGNLSPKRISWLDTTNIQFDPENNDYDSEIGID